MQRWQTTLNHWMRWLHIYSAAPVLLSMLFFAITGFLLNHSDWHFGDIKQQQQRLELPSALRQQNEQNREMNPSLSVLQWLDTHHGIRGVDMEIEWEASEQLLVMVLDSPSGTYTIEVYTDTGEVDIFTRQLPWLDWLNNLHRGKHVNSFWRFLSDLSALFMLLFCLSGFWLVWANTLHRISGLSWISLGTVVLMLSIYLMH